MKIRLLTNESLTNHFPDDLVIEGIAGRLKGRSIAGRVRVLFGALRKSDAYLGFNSDFDIFLAATLNRLAFGHARVLLWDTNLHRPIGAAGVLKSVLKRVLFKFVDYFVVMHRHTAAYSRYYGIPARKFVYVPFKANNFEMLEGIESRDEGYILSCGASYRDFNCLLAAVRDLGYPVKIVLPKRSIAQFHNTHFAAESVPGHVQVIEHDMNKDTWNAYLSRATVVVIPIERHAIQPAGISVYLEAMALGKPVIISRGASTEGLIDETKAALYEPGDAAQLRLRIEDLLANPAQREQIAREGQRYALSLEGERRLVRDLERQVIDLARRKR
ncbi:MAG TPA: glycosyltransferase [Vicinamibacterales bacterium]|nr:glycosyltransferase [Vicinamibacterales bacterium]